jgi:hypothetical protein
MVMPFVLRAAFCALACLTAPAVSASRVRAQAKPEAVQPKPPENLTETLKRQEGVIEPPAMVDPEMVTPPPPNGARTPVLPPSAAPPQPPQTDGPAPRPE